MKGYIGLIMLIPSLWVTEIRIRDDWVKGGGLGHLRAGRTRIVHIFTRVQHYFLDIVSFILVNTKRKCNPLKVHVIKKSFLIDKTY